jgi:hypothetical protein
VPVELSRQVVAEGTRVTDVSRQLVVRANVPALRIPHHPHFRGPLLQGWPASHARSTTRTRSVRRWIPRAAKRRHPSRT